MVLTLSVFDALAKLETPFFGMRAWYGAMVSRANPAFEGKGKEEMLQGLLDFCGHRFNKAKFVQVFVIDP